MKKILKLLTCGLLVGLMASCNEPSVSPSPSEGPQPSTPSVQPSTPSTPVTPSVKPSTPSTQPSTPSVKPSTPSVQPSSPSVDPSSPSVQPSSPSVQPSSPSVQPSSPSVQPSSPSIEPSVPSLNPDEILVPGENEELVSYEVNVSEKLEAGKGDSDIVLGKFTLGAGTEVRNRTKTWTNPDDPSQVVEFTKSIKLGSSSNKVTVSSPGRGVLYLWVQNGSSGATTQKISVTGPDGTQELIEFAGTDQGSPVVRLEIIVGEGDYVIARPSGTVDIFNMELKCVVGKSEEAGFEIASQGKVDFLEGEAFDYSALQLNKVYGNGRLDTLPTNDENVTIDASAYNPNVPGTYKIKVKYRNYTELSYDVVVYDIVDVSLGLDAIEKIANNSSGNGVYFNHSVKEVYDLNEEFDTTGLNVIVTGKNGEETKDFRVSSNITYSGFDSATAGKKDVVVTYAFAGQTMSETLTVHVVDTAPCKDASGMIKLKVDPEYTGAVGAAVEGYNVFTTIQQALDYLEDHSAIEATDRKLIELAPATYTEKLEITVPYLTIKGANAETTVIEWDSLYGVSDAGGFPHTTDSTQTVAVREEAVGVTIEGVTISNWYNSQERFTERGEEIERALALLVQADQFVMRDGKLLGVQDTLELFKGRQYFERVFISGYTDFIFGTNNTTYFTDCEIHTVDTLKDDKGTAGYLTAFKGSNKGEGDYVKYGAIFDGCDFTADEGVTKGTTAIGRTWGAYAAVAIINSELGDHISVDGFDPSANKNKRYISMNGILPTDATVQFKEYNNTGAGAISEAVAGCSLLTAEEAAQYVDLDVIFGTANGAVSYVNAWDPLSEEIVVDQNIYYHFDGKSTATGTSYTYDQDIAKGSTGTFENIAIDATKGKVTARSSDTQINAGAKLSFDVAAGTTVLVTTYPGYHGYSLNGVETSSDSFAKHYVEATTVEFEALETVYLFSIIVKPNQEAPEAATLSGLQVKGQTTSFFVGDEFTYDKLVVKASYSDFSVLPLTAEDYTVTLDREPTEAGDYTATITYGELTETYKVTYVALGVDPDVVAKNTVISFGTNGNHSTSQLIVGSGTTVRDNGGDNSQIKGLVTVKVAAGATVTLNGYPNYTNYTLSVNGVEKPAAITADIYTLTVAEDSTFEINCGDNHYFYSIVVEYKAVTESSVISFGNEGNHADSKLMLAEGANVRDNGGNNSQIKGTVSLQVLPGAIINVNSYSGYTNYQVSVNGGTASEAITGTSYELRVSELSTIDFICGDNNYFYNISVSYPIDESQKIAFGSEGNYGSSDLVLGSDVNVRDNGSDNSQISGNISLYVEAGGTINVKGYPNYTNYTVSVNGGAASEAITAETYTLTVEENCVVTFVCGSNNYLYSIDVVFPVYIEDNASITFGSEGNYGSSDLVLGGDVNVRDNGGNNTQISGTVSLNVRAGGTVTIHGYPNYTSYTVSVNGGAASEAITAETHAVTVQEDSVVTLVCGSNNYFYDIAVSYPINKNTTISFGSEGNYGSSALVVGSGTNVRDNGGNNSQITGSLTLDVAAGATITINGYPSYTNYTVAINGGAASEAITATEHSFTVTEAGTVELVGLSNNYFYSIVISF